MTDATLTIDALGAQGDGIAHVKGEAVYLPFTLPGEVVRADVVGERGDVQEILSASADRIEPVCAHFGQCGGCALQHLKFDAYADWKRRMAETALRHRGVDLPVREPVISPPHSRRRAKITLRQTGGGLIAGFAERRSNRILNITECPVLRPELIAVVALLRQHLSPVIKGVASATLTVTDQGVDISLDGVTSKGRDSLEMLARAAERCDLARLSLGDEIIVERRSPMITFADVQVALPPGAFLQATQEGEAALVDFVRAAVTPASRVVDLFAGVGTFALSIADMKSMHAVESDIASVSALQSAARRSGRKVTVERRDLFRNPLMTQELKNYDVAIVDPPRAGARAQVDMLAQSSVSTVVMVSCNPATFARDVRALMDAGFSAEWVQPVDQFLWSPHLELVATFRR